MTFYKKINDLIKLKNKNPNNPNIYPKKGGKKPRLGDNKMVVGRTWKLEPHLAIEKRQFVKIIQTKQGYDG